METPLFQRGLHFLRKAGVRRFAIKSAYWARSHFDRRYAASRDRKTDVELLDKLSRLPRVDGHVTIPVLDFKMKVRDDDPGLSKELILNGVREQDAVDFLKPHLRRCKTIIEIGANQGYYLIQEALLSPPDARIHAFEPHPDNVQTSKLNLVLNGIENKCHLVQAAISDKRGKANLVVSKRSNWHTLTPSIENNLDFSGNTIEVESLTVDEYSAGANIDRVDLIRMDVEGHETSVMRGAANTIARSPDIMVFLEFHTSLLRQAGESPEDFLSELRKMGLKCLTVCGKGKHLVNPTWEELIQSLELVTARYGTHMFFAR